MTTSLDLDTIELARGAHHPDDGEFCLLEIISFIAGEPWSDHPQCVCPVLAAFGRAWNDALPDDKLHTSAVDLFERMIALTEVPA